MLSQIHINYLNSLLCKGKVGKFYASMRLPWIETANGDNFASLRSVDWQIHVHGKAKLELVDSIRSQSLRFHEFTWDYKMKDAGFKQNTPYLIRPDGHVMLATDKQWLCVLNLYLEAVVKGEFEAE